MLAEESQTAPIDSIFDFFETTYVTPSVELLSLVFYDELCAEREHINDLRSFILYHWGLAIRERYSNWEGWIKDSQDVHKWLLGSPSHMEWIARCGFSDLEEWGVKEGKHSKRH
jgi:hypothetical protein